MELGFLWCGKGMVWEMGLGGGGSGGGGVLYKHHSLGFYLCPVKSAEHQGITT